MEQCTQFEQASIIVDDTNIEFSKVPRMLFEKFFHLLIRELILLKNRC